jgi:hypothetical protein
MEAMECQYHGNCGGWCETDEEREQCLCCDCLDAERENDADDAALAAVREAVRGYYAALDQREDGGVAQDKAFRAIEQALGMRWIQGASLMTANP